jgi:hypothetical protein
VRGCWIAGLLAAAACAPFEEGVTSGGGSGSGGVTTGTPTASSTAGPDDPTSASTMAEEGSTAASFDVAGSTGGVVELQCSDGTFVPGELCLQLEHRHDVVADPRTIATADIDADGWLDLVVGSDSKGEVSVLHGNGDVFDTPAPFIGMAGRTDLVILAMLDTDPLPDLAIVDADASTLFVHLNNAGAFETATPSVFGGTATAAAAGDLDGDDRPEIVLVTSGGTATVLANHGLGAFMAGQAMMVGSNPRAVALGDVDQNGWTDIVTANEGGNSARVVYNDNGTLELARDTLAAQMQPRAVALGDLDGDGWLDIVLANFGSDSLSVRFAAPMAGFADEATIVDVGEEPAAVLADDLDADGDLDLAVAHHADVDSVSVHVGAGDGTFAPPMVIAVGDDPSAIAAGDFDDDGATDLAVICNRSDEAVILLSDP